MPDEGNTATIEAPSTAAAEAPSPSTSQTFAEAAAPAIAARETAYDTAFKEHLTEDDAPATPAAEPKADATAEVKDEAAPAAPAQQDLLTEGDKHVLSRAKIKPESLAGMSRETIDSFVNSFREQQAEQDRLRSDLGRYKPKEEAPKAEAQPQQTAKATPYGSKVDEVIGKIATSYDDEIKPLGDLFKETDGRLSQIEQTAQAIPAIMELLNDLVIDQALSGLATDYPSISSPESRDKVAARFLTEWNTGAYMRDGVKIGQAIRNAAKSAAKVVFTNTTEASAAASLVQNNKARLASQPKTGAPTTRAAPKTKEDVYDAAFDETIGKELAR